MCDLKHLIVHSRGTFLVKVIPPFDYISTVRREGNLKNTISVRDTILVLVNLAELGWC